MNCFLLVEPAWFSEVESMSGLQFSETCQVSGDTYQSGSENEGKSHVCCYLNPFTLLICRGSPPTTSTSSSSLTNDVTKQPVSRDITSVRPANVGNMGVQYTPHSHQFPRTRKMFDKGPEQVKRLCFQF